MREKQGFGTALDCMAAVRAFDDAEFIGGNEPRVELINLKRFATSGTLALHEFHCALTFENSEPKIP